MEHPFKSIRQRVKEDVDADSLWLSGLFALSPPLLSAGASASFFFSEVMISGGFFSKQVSVAMPPGCSSARESCTNSTMTTSPETLTTSGEARRAAAAKTSSKDRYSDV